MAGEARPGGRAAARERAEHGRGRERAGLPRARPRRARRKPGAALQGAREGRPHALLSAGRDGRHRGVARPRSGLPDVDDVELAAQPRQPLRRRAARADLSLRPRVRALRRGTQHRGPGPLAASGPRALLREPVGAPRHGPPFARGAIPSRRAGRGAVSAPSPATVPSRVRILVLSSFPPAVGGGEIQTLLQTREMARRGHEVTVIDLRPRPDGPTEETLDGVKVVRVPGASAPVIGTLGFHLRLAARVRAAARAADVVQLNHIGTGLITASAALWMKKLPRVLVVWGSAAEGVGPFAPSLRFALARSVARRCQRVVSLATAVVPNLERAGFDATRIRMIPNGVETERFRPRAEAAA